MAIPEQLLIVLEDSSPLSEALAGPRQAIGNGFDQLDNGLPVPGVKPIEYGIHQRCLLDE